MLNRIILLMGMMTIFLVACSNSADEEIDMLFQTLSDDKATDAFIDLLERVDEEAPFDEQLLVAKEEVEKTKKELESIVISTDVAIKLRDRYVSSLEDFETMILLIETNGPNLSDEDWETLEQLSAEANEKQMDLIREKFQRMEIDLEG